MSAFGVVNVATLRAQGMSKQAVGRAVAAGVLTPVIRGWYATTTAHPDVVRAMELGGRAGCVTALGAGGAWLPPEAGIHLAMPTSSSGRRLTREAPDDITVHWHGNAAATGSRYACSPLEMSINHLVDCQPPHFAVAVLDSLLQKRILTHNRLVAILSAASPAGRRLIRFLDGRAESGIESVARYRLAIAGVTSEPQVVLPGIGRVDLLVDGWLAVELDGREFHAQRAAFGRDRQRTNRIYRNGKLILQFDYSSVIHDWPTVEETVRSTRSQHAPVR